MKKFVALLEYLHFATLRVPEHHTHHIGRIVQPQIRSLSVALLGKAAESSSTRLVNPPTSSNKAQRSPP